MKAAGQRVLAGVDLADRRVKVDQMTGALWIFRAAALLVVIGTAPLLAEGWVVRPDPVFAGQYGAVGDPSVIRAADGTYLMFHNCLDVLRNP